MQPPQALAPIAYVLDLNAQVRAFAVVLQRVHDDAGVESVGFNKRFKSLAHALIGQSADYALSILEIIYPLYRDNF
jgi:hypothetical protein